MKTLITLLVAFLLFPHGSKAQISNINKVSGEPLREGKYDQVDGSPYLGDGAWTTGTAFDAKGNRYENLEMRYNAFDDNLEIKVDDRILVPERVLITRFEFVGQRPDGTMGWMVFSNGFSLAGISDKLSYFRVMYENDPVKILERVRVTQVTSPAYGAADRKIFVTETSTYLVTANKAEKVRINAKSLGNTFPEHKTAIRNYLKLNDPDVTADEDLKALGDFLVSLQPRR